VLQSTRFSANVAIGFVICTGVAGQPGFRTMDVTLTYGLPVARHPRFVDNIVQVLSVMVPDAQGDCPPGVPHAVWLFQMDTIAAQPPVTCPHSHPHVMSTASGLIPPAAIGVVFAGHDGMTLALS
jgi:hypothetical protein